jgi:hypothetical protein
LRYPLILFLLLPFCLSCHQANNIAPGGALLFLIAEPTQIGFNGTSTLTVTGTEETGVPLPDGTKVSFGVDLAGNVSPSTVQLLSGTATSTYHATFTAGEITITATSGSVEANTTITVVDNIQQNVFVSANPTTFPTGGGTSLISAVVTDDSGKPVVGTGVQFSTTAGTLQSGGSVIETNGNGVATDVLVTTENATVTASTDDGFSGQTTILVGVGRIVCHMSVSNTSPKVGQTVAFFDTTDDPGAQILRFHWDFGDAVSAEGQNVQHAYSNAGTFNVVHSVIDSKGNTIFCDPFPLQVSQ